MLPSWVIFGCNYFLVLLMPDARLYFPLPTPFVLKRAGVLIDAQLAFETWGTLNAARDNVVLIYTGMSPSAHAAQSPKDLSPGWWEDMLGPGKPIDTQRWFVICANSLGSCRGSTGPASINPQTKQPYRMQFPELSVEDIASATHALLHGLEISQVRLAIGCSMGGMSALAHAAMFPGQIKDAVLISTAARAEAFAIAIRSLQRELVINDPYFQNGTYLDSQSVALGMGLARKLGVISYRSAEEWRVRFGRQNVQPQHRSSHAFGTEFEVQRYLQGHADRWAGSFDPCSYIYLSRAMDWFDLSSIYPLQSQSRLFERALVIGVASDILFPLAQQAELSNQLAKTGTQSTLAALPSVQGHDAFLVDMENFGPAIARFAAQC
jgi:homoserine O-acetyltransferase/O-succinyltransferase